MFKRALVLSGLMLSAAAFAQVKNPGTYLSAGVGDWATFDPAYCYDLLCGEVLMNTLETLVFFDGTSTSKFVPLLAAEVPTKANGGISADGKTYTFKLRKGLKFSDGSPLTAQDVEYSLERQLVASTDSGASVLLAEPLLGTTDPIRKGGKIGYDAIDRAIETRGDDTVIFKLAKPFSPFLSVLATPYFAIYSKNDAVKAGEWSGTARDWEKFNNLPDADSKFIKRPPLGSGPFVLERYDQGKNVVLRRNGNYWRAPAKLERVILQQVPDETTRIQLLRNGDVDSASVTRPQLETVSKLPGIRVVDNLPSLSLNGVFMNRRIDGTGTNYLGSGKLDGRGIPSNFFADKNLRKAFAYSFDYGTYLRDVFQNKARQQNVPIIYGLPAHNSTAPKYQFNKAAAERYFKAAWDGKVWENGFVLPVFYNTGNTNRQRAMEIFKRNIESINPKFKIEVRELQFSQLSAQRRSGQVTMWAGNWSGDYADPHNFIFPFYHSQGTFGSQQRFKNDRLDELIERAAAETELKARTQLYNQIQRIGFDEVVGIPLYQDVGYVAMRDWVKGRVLNPVFAGDYYYTISK
ncbi:peptide/nickel transport system substrate-binding protein [Deinobacterium chartae]|uniref:Peptide/nickel transport system substrate-binding protein n=1 Tax=Deinobacterium chartae TaxID=521158 RepID=A0A841I5K0_9DEIO|nr:ABC transporter substrate-binding protein [Deinobacterium chartae]MBB6099549.1 peptide/nickel transport system substrate-binding protein [Deinobacterium chartae]